MKTSSIASGDTPERSSVAAMAAVPSSFPVAPERSPSSPPIGVRAPSIINTSLTTSTLTICSRGGHLAPTAAALQAQLDGYSGEKVLSRTAVL